LITFVTCIFVTIVYAILVHACTALLVWITIVGTGAGILGLAHMIKGHKAKTPDLKKEKDETKKNRTSWKIKIATYVLYTLFGFYFVCICCMLKNIKIAIAVLKTSACIMKNNIRILFMPFYSAICVIVWTALWLFFFVHLISAGNITQPKDGHQMKSIKLTGW